MKNRIRTPQPTSRGRGRLAVGVVALSAGLGLLLTPLAASGQAVEAESLITIVQTPTDPQPAVPPCVAPELAVLNGTVTYALSAPSAEYFRITIHASVPLCEPLEAKAVVYALPGNPYVVSPWPQKLQEVKPFTIQEQGSTVITFAKDCDPVQFDVITGATPDVINNGSEHSLLFLGNLDTAYQHQGIYTEECVGQATTSTSSTTSSTSTTVAVQGSTTVKAPTTTSRSGALAATTIPSGSNTAGTSASGLAVTGTTTRPFALIGSGLVLIGIAAMLGSRRRYV